MNPLSNQSFIRPENVIHTSPSIKFGNQTVNETSQLQAVAAMQNDILILRSPYTSQAEKTKASMDLKSQNNRSRMLNLMIDQEKRQEARMAEEKRKTAAHEEVTRQNAQAAEQKELSEKAEQEAKEKQKAEAEKQQEATRIAAQEEAHRESAQAAEQKALSEKAEQEAKEKQKAEAEKQHEEEQKKMASKTKSQ